VDALGDVREHFLPLLFFREVFIVFFRHRVYALLWSKSGAKLENVFILLDTNARDCSSHPLATKPKFDAKEEVRAANTALVFVGRCFRWVHRLY
jgi:hypothetical protein